MKFRSKIVLSLAGALFIFGCHAVPAFAGDGADTAKNAYDECFRCYNDYIGAVNSGAGMQELSSYAEKYRAALEKYQKLTGSDTLATGAANDVSAASRITDSLPTGSAADSNQAAPKSTSSGVVMAAALNVRSGPWGDVIGSMKVGSKIEIISKEGSWYKIRFNGKEAFVHAGYIATETSVATAHDGYVDADGLLVRSGPWGSELGTLPRGAAIEVLEKKDDWYVIKYNDREGYVRAEYISDSKAKTAAAAAPSEMTASSSQAAASVQQKTEAAESSTRSASTSFSKSSEPLIGGPVPPNRVTSTYGPREMFGKNFHYGVDIAVPTGTALRSVGDGRVVSTEWNYGGGQLITIKYDNGMTSTYAHCKDSSVTAGSVVTKGQVVGHTNNTGAYTTGPHLHFAVKDASNNYVDPLKISSLWY